MKNDTTAGQLPVQDEAQETFRVVGPQPDGWTILYNDAVDLLLPEHSAVVRCYLALCKMSNGQRACHPNLDQLGAAMGGMDRQSARRATRRLEELGLLFIKRPQTQGRGTAIEYSLTTPKKGITQDTHTEKGINGAPKRVSNGNKKGIKAGDTPTSNTLTGEQKKDDVTSHANETTISFSEKQQKQPTQKNKQPQVPPIPTVPIDNIELRHPYWQDEDFGFFRSDAFARVFAQYPKKEHEMMARTAWREHIGGRMDAQSYNGPLLRTMHYAAQWYARTVAGIGGHYRPIPIDAKDVPLFAKWIREERWNDAPEWARQGRPTP